MEQNLYKYFLVGSVLIQSIILCKYIFDMPHSLFSCSIVMCGMLFGMIYSYRIEFKKIAFRRIQELFHNISIQILLIIVMGVMIVVTGILLWEPSYILLGVVIAGLIPAFWLLIRKEYQKTFFDAVSLATTIIFIFVTIISIIFVPLSNTQYSSIIGNPNEFGNVLVFFLCCLLYRYSTTGKKRYLFFSAIDVSFVVLTISRTTYLCTIAIILITIVYYVTIKGYKRTIINTVKMITLFLVSFLLLFSLLTYVNSTIRYIEKQTFGSEYIYYAKLYKYDGSQMSFDDLFKYIGIRTSKGVNLEDDKNEDIDINKMSSGRLQIWEGFIDNIGIQGHGIGDKVYIASTKQTGLDAHNTYLNNGYYYGGLAGIAMFIYMIVLFFYNFLYFTNFVKCKKSDPKFYLLSMIYISFFILSILSSVFSPFHSMVAFGFWFICFYDNRLNLKREK